MRNTQSVFLEQPKEWLSIRCLINDTSTVEMCQPLLDVTSCSSPCPVSAVLLRAITCSRPLGYRPADRASKGAIQSKTICYSHSLTRHPWPQIYIFLSMFGISCLSRALSLLHFLTALGRSRGNLLCMGPCVREVVTVTVTVPVEV